MSSLTWMTGLKFDTLREANLQRLPEFKNAKGETAHSQANGSDWSLNDWMLAVQGELGEAASILKKIRRGDYSLDTVVKTNHDGSTITVRDLLAKEYADVQAYLDILAFRSGVDLGKATIDKFNEVSVRIGSNIRIKEDGTDWEYSK